ncbi:TetR/AcrR family transcriptional regulator [Aureisphaera galaxeae]|uniref:TetR/AcrR family transcriptional regulator n=1 Tax=Aureisphaera galaxeae TaxID=1538023 RepID=UPI002350FC8F|nr:TetR/AcrR family transcriptional regulator [Aureisphaera galaxeae]MDC8002638.1 TetR/AcrR family transcriptional regulator [Aureisphaera galaxeae]
MNTDTKDVRSAIIDTASQLFYKNGYNNTGIDEILTEANINEKTLNTYFDSKEEICLAHLKHRNEEFSKQVFSYTQQAPEGKDRILAVFNFLELFYKMEEFNGCWSVKVLSELPPNNIVLRSEIMSQKKGLLGFIETLLVENAQKGSKEDFKTLAQRIYLLLEGAVAQSNIHKEEWPIVQAKEMCRNLLKDF